MSTWTDLRTPVEQELVIGFYDLRGYTVFCQRTEPLRVLEIIAGYHSLVGRIIVDAGGILIKAIGDAGMFAFWSECTDHAVQAMQSYHLNGNRWLQAQGYTGTVRTVMHAGPVAIGMVGGPGREQLDVIGSTVNIAGSMRMEGEISITPAVFRLLSAELRKLFKKHTPPVSYIGVDDSRPQQPRNQSISR